MGSHVRLLPWYQRARTLTLTPRVYEYECTRARARGAQMGAPHACIRETSYLKVFFLATEEGRERERKEDGRGETLWTPEAVILTTIAYRNVIFIRISPNSYSDN